MSSAAQERRVVLLPAQRRQAQAGRHAGVVAGYLKLVGRESRRPRGLVGPGPKLVAAARHQVEQLRALGDRVVLRKAASRLPAAESYRK